MVHWFDFDENKTPLDTFVIAQDKRNKDTFLGFFTRSGDTIIFRGEYIHVNAWILSFLHLEYIQYRPINNDLQLALHTARSKREDGDSHISLDCCKNELHR